MHYAEFKLPDAALLRTLIEAFPFAAVAINGGASPILAQAPLTFREKPGSPGAVEFHLARQNVITDAIDEGMTATILVNGPSGHVSPTWYTSRFPDASADRSRTAPTWDYVSATLAGRLRRLSRAELQTQITDLVAHHEPVDGWRIEEIDPDLFESWCGLLIGYRLDIESFDLTVKLSQNQMREDRPGIATGLRKRAGFADTAMASLVEGFDGTSASVEDMIRALSGPTFKT